MTARGPRAALRALAGTAPAANIAITGAGHGAAFRVNAGTERRMTELLSFAETMKISAMLIGAGALVALLMIRRRDLRSGQQKGAA